MRFTIAAMVVLVGLLGTVRAAEPGELWTYDGGWFALEADKNWYEMNEEAYRKKGKPWKFEEVRRTREFVELYDASRKVSLRLYANRVEARWDHDGAAAEWKELMKGRWKKRT